MGEFKESAVRVDAILRAWRMTLDTLDALPGVERVALSMRIKGNGHLLAHPVGFLVVTHLSSCGGVLKQTALPAEDKRMIVTQSRTRR